jgi:DNA-binding MarR family transcriptional regulator
MQISSSATSERFLKAFWGVRQRFVRQVAPVMQERHDLEISEYHLLGYVAESQLAPTEIACTMLLPPYIVSRRLDSLEKRGLIQRSLDPQDARRRILTVTDTGRSRLAEARATMDAEVGALLSKLTEAELTTLIERMETLATDEPSKG